MCRPVYPLTVAAVLLVVAAAAPAQNDNADRFTGVVTGDDVYVRAGASQNYYAVTKLHSGDLVEVHDNLFGWYRISPPPGVFSYVSKAYVEVSGDGGTGEITGDRVRVRAPSPAGPDRSYRIQAKLNTGDKVTILGSDASYYRIVPPDDVYLFISQDYVDRATDAQIAAGRQVRQADASAEPAAAPAETTIEAPMEATPAETAPAEAAAPAPVEVAPAAELTIEPSAETIAEVTGHAEPPDAETAVKVSAEPAVEVAVEAGAEPVAETPDAGLTAEIAPDEALEAAPAEVMIEVESESPQAADEADDAGEAPDVVVVPARSIDHAVGQAMGVAETAPDEVADEAPQVEAAGAADYNAIGILRTSTLYTGQKLPLLYRVVDPSTGLTLAYVRVQPDYSAAGMLGRVVGVVGTKRRDPGLKRNIIDAVRIDRLGPAD